MSEQEKQEFREKVRHIMEGIFCDLAVEISRYELSESEREEVSSVLQILQSGGVKNA